ncbi:MAG: hypothetical protein WCF99_16525 [Chloroflexales bacterium]
MPDQRMKVADLDEGRLSRLKAVEVDLGTYIVALEPASPFADLGTEQVQRLQDLERELGLVLLAYRLSDG